MDGGVGLYDLGARKWNFLRDLVGHFFSVLKWCFGLRKSVVIQKWRFKSFLVGGDGSLFACSNWNIIDTSWTSKKYYLWSCPHISLFWGRSLWLGLSHIKWTSFSLIGLLFKRIFFSTQFSLKTLNSLQVYSSMCLNRGLCCFHF